MLNKGLPTFATNGQSETDAKRNSPLCWADCNSLLAEATDRNASVKWKELFGVIRASISWWQRIKPNRDCCWANYYTSHLVLAKTFGIIEASMVVGDKILGTLVQVYERVGYFSPPIVCYSLLWHSIYDVFFLATHRIVGLNEDIRVKRHEILSKHGRDHCCEIWIICIKESERKRNAKLPLVTLNCILSVVGMSCLPYLFTTRMHYS